MNNWETADSIPPLMRKRKLVITLAPGQIIRRVVRDNASSSAYNALFSRTGRTDYHATSRTVESVNYLYIWRDPLPEGQ